MDPSLCGLPQVLVSWHKWRNRRSRGLRLAIYSSAPLASCSRSSAGVVSFCVRKGLAFQAQKVSAKQTIQGQLESRQQLGAKYPVTFEHLRRPIGVLLQEVDEDLSARGVYDPKFHGTVSGITEALFVEVIASGRR